MEEIIKYFKDFYNIFEYLNNKQIGYYSNNLKEYYVKRSELDRLLEVNKYDNVEGKLLAWRSLNLIESRDKKFTKKVRVGGKIKNFVALNVEAYNFLKRLEVNKKVNI